MVLDELFLEAGKLAEKAEPFALVTVIQLLGSAPRDVGTMMLVRRDGSILGTIGGGRLEARVIEETKKAIHEGCSHSFELNPLAAVDQRCGGAMTFFLGVYAAPNRQAAAFLQRCHELARHGHDFALTSVSAATDPSLAVGTSMLVTEAGGRVGGLGNAAVDDRMVQDGQQALTAKKPRLVEVSSLASLDRSLAGSAQIFVNVIRAKPTFIMFGAGHVAYPTAKLAHRLGFRVVVVDPRPEYANRERYPEAAEIIRDPLAEAIDKLRIDEDTYIAVVTHDHDLDEAIVERVAGSKAAYVGMIGSEAKALITLRNLKKKGLPIETLRRIRTPIGLDVGADAPEEIAVSIMAEVLQVRRGGTGAPMSISEEPLY